MKKVLYLLWALMFAFVLVSCNDDDDDNDDPTPTVNESETLVKWLESADSPLGKDYVNTDMPAIIQASEVKTLNETGQVYIIDIRAAADFDAGHIENAVNLAAGDVMTHLDGMDLSPYTKVAIVCYSGQTAGWLTCILRLNGYEKAYSMLFGMCSWHEDFAGSWNSNVGNSGAAQFTATPTAKNEPGEMPDLNTGETTGAAIFEDRVATVMAEGFAAAKITNTAVLGSPENYYIVNYWAEADYTSYGHIPGAVQYTPKESMAYDVDLTTLPTDKTIVVYCWTGQTSANLAAYLRILGYDAVSLLFGANGMIYDDLTAHKWSAGAIQGYDYVTSK